MDYGIDTSALMRLATQQPPDLAERVTDRVKRLLDAGAVIHVSDVVVMEAYYALQHSYHATKANAVAALRAIADQPCFSFSSEAVEALSQPNPATMSPGLVDRMIVGEYSARGLRVLACEKDFRKIDGAEVVE